MTRGSHSLARRERARIAEGVAFVPTQRPYAEQYVPRNRLVGRCVLALSAGPMLARDLARACNVTDADVDDVADELAVVAEALRAGDDLLVSLRWAASFGGVEGWRRDRDAGNDARKAA